MLGTLMLVTITAIMRRMMVAIPIAAMPTVRSAASSQRWPRLRCQYLTLFLCRTRVRSMFPGRFIPTSWASAFARLT
jgi:hypothetical protein